LAQSTNLHRFSAIDLNPDHSVFLTLTSGVPSTFRNYYDLFPIDASPNLVNWTPLTTLFRTNRVANGVTLLDTEAAGLPLRFYRTPTNQLITAIPPPDGPYRVGVFLRLLTE